MGKEHEDSSEKIKNKEKKKAKKGGNNKIEKRNGISKVNSKNRRRSAWGGPGKKKVTCV